MPSNHEANPPHSREAQPRARPKAKRPGDNHEEESKNGTGGGIRGFFNKVAGKDAKDSKPAGTGDGSASIKNKGPAPKASRPRSDKQRDRKVGNTESEPVESSVPQQAKRRQHKDIINESSIKDDTPKPLRRRKTVVSPPVEPRPDSALPEPSKMEDLPRNRSRKYAAADPKTATGFDKKGRSGLDLGSRRAAKPRKDKKSRVEELKPEANSTRDIGGNRTRDSTRDSGTKRTKGSKYHETPAKLEPDEAKCSKCDEIIYVDPSTGKPLDPQPPARRETCDDCGQLWPEDKPYSEKILKKIEERLKNSKHKDVLCKDCEKRYIDEGVQVDERSLSEFGNARDHWCKRTEFARDVKNVDPRLFPNDPDRPSGNRRALLMGMNYSGQKNELKGCRNDVKNMYSFLKSRGYKDQNIDILMDIWEYKPPTRKKIISHMEELVKGAKAGDSLFVHFSGHGGQTKDKEGDELDGVDEGIYPVDYHISHPKGILVDDIMHDILAHVPPGVHLTALFDSCHSGSVLDLPYVLSPVGIKKVDPRKPRQLDGVGRVILWSGCKDSQTSADTKVKGTSVGAMSYAFITANDQLLEKKQLSKKKLEYTYDELLIEIRRILHEKYAQIPQLSSTQPLDPDKHKVYV